MKKNTYPRGIVSAIESLAKIAANASYDGEVSIYLCDGEYRIVEFTDHNSYLVPAHEGVELQHIVSERTHPYERESAAALVRCIRAELGV